MGKTLIYGCGVVGRSMESLLGESNVVMYDDNASKSSIAWEQIKFNEIDLCVVSPGVGESNKLNDIEKHGIPIVSELQYCLDRCDSKIVSVTGTNGKTTITRMLSHVLTKLGVSNYLLGNGEVPFSSSLNSLKQNDIVVLESSSFMLSRVKAFNPLISIVSNIDVDHLDYHKTVENYIESKVNNFINQGEGRYAIFNSDDKICKQLIPLAKKASTYSTKAKADLYIEGNSIVNAITNEKAPIDLLANFHGHNLSNALAVLLCSSYLGIKLTNAIYALSSYSFEKHKFELICNKNGMQFINDSKATNTSAVKSALSGIKGTVAIILGGDNKGCDLYKLISNFNDNVKFISAIGSCKNEIFKIASSCYIPCKECSSMLEAVSCCIETGCQYVLLSPACASIDEYSSYVERGELFTAVVKELTQ